jgi:hypothetical protein
MPFSIFALAQATAPAVKVVLEGTLAAEAARKVGQP